MYVYASEKIRHIFNRYFVSKNHRVKYQMILTRINTVEKGKEKQCNPWASPIHRSGGICRSKAREKRYKQ